MVYRPCVVSSFSLGQKNKTRVIKHKKSRRMQAAENGVVLLIKKHIYERLDENKTKIRKYNKSAKNEPRVLGGSSDDSLVLGKKNINGPPSAPGVYHYRGILFFSFSFCSSWIDGRNNND